jgi:hypothetical protein
MESIKEEEDAKSDKSADGGLRIRPVKQTKS